MKTFTIGDKVTWVSQAAGFAHRKTGTIIEVVPAGAYRKTFIKGAGCTPRRHISYVVSVPGKTSRATPKYFWPITSLVEPAGNHAFGRYGID